MGSSWAESALNWWEEAGVDTIVGETPRDWLAAPARAATPAPATPAPVTAAAVVPPQETLPDEIQAFRAWFADGARLGLGAPAAPRLGPAGDPASGLMILVDMPGQEDFAAGALMAGEAGALFDRMLVAMGRSRETIYLAPLSPLRTPSGALDAALAARLATIARHHIGLVRPRALLIFGDACAKALAGLPVAGARGRWLEVETPAGAIRTLVTIRPEKLVTQPKLKTHAWADLQMLIEELKP